MWNRSAVPVRHHRATVASDLLLFLGGDHLNLIWGQAETFQPLGRRGSNAVAVLSDAAGEDEKIGASQQSHVCPDCFSNGDGENIESETRLWIVAAGALLQSFHIALAGGERKKAAVMVEQVFKLVGVELLLAEKINDDAGVEVAGSRSHGNSASGRQAHGGVDRYSISQGTEARSIAQVRENRSFGKVRAEMMDQGFVGNAVEAVATDAGVEVALRQGEMRCNFRNRLVKGVVEAGEMLPRKDRLRGGDQLQSLRDVQGCKVGCGAQLFHDLWRDDLVLAKLGASVHHAMADRDRRTVCLLLKGRGQSAERFALPFVNTFALKKGFSIRGTNVQRAIVSSNALGTSCQQRLFLSCTPVSRAGSVDAEFQRRRPAVEDKDRTVFPGQFARHSYPGHFQLRISSLSMPSV